MNIRAAVLHQSGAALPYADSKPLSIEQVQLDLPGSGEVLIRVAAAGLCHSDLSVINGDRPRPLPMVLGHEAAGIVEECGTGVDDLHPGDHVLMVFVPSCGHCLPCAEGRPALCEPALKANINGCLLSGARRLSFNQKPVHHLLGVAAFAEYATVSRRSLIKLDADLPLHLAALFGCAVMTGAGAVANTAAMPFGATAAIVGLGGVGLAALICAVAMGASRIVAVDLSDAKLAIARQLGATDTFNAADADCLDNIRSATSGGVQYAFEMAGSVKAMELAYQITRRGGLTVTAGLPNPEQRMNLPLLSLIAEERTIKGSYLGSCVPVRDVPKFISLFRQGKLPVDKLLTAQLRLEEINPGFDALHEARAVRQVITFA
jgi:alcohol dehydrogenase